MDLHFLLGEKKFDNPNQINNNESFNNISFPNNKNSINPMLEENNSIFKINEDMFYINNESFPPNNTYEDSKEKNKIEKQDEIKEEEKKFLTDKKLIEDIQLKVRNDIYTKRPFKETKKELGRNKKELEGLGEHNKYSDDNLIRKCKHVILEKLRLFINNKIALLYSNEDKEKLSDMFILILKQNQIVSSKAEYNKFFLSKTLKEIFSEEISSKYTRYPPEHNRNIIENLINDKDPLKNTIFKRIFNLTFIDCLNHFSGCKPLEILNGFITLEDYLKLLKIEGMDEDYCTLFKHFIQNFEKIIMEKKPRIRIRKKKDDVFG